MEVVCVRQDETELELIVKVKAYDTEMTFPLTADKDDFRTFLETLQQANENMVGMSELKQRFEDKRISFEVDGLISVTDNIGVGRVIVAGNNCAYRHKGNDCHFKFIADQKALVTFMWGLQTLNS